MALPRGSHPRTRASVRLSEELSKHGAAAAGGRATQYTLRSNSQTAGSRSLRSTTIQSKKTCSQESLPARFTRSSASQRCAVQTPKPTSATALARAASKHLSETGPAAITTTPNPTALSASYEESTKSVDPAEDGRKRRLSTSRRYRGPAQSTRDAADDTFDSNADSDAYQRLDYQYTTKMRTSNSSTATTASDGSGNSEANSCINVVDSTRPVDSHSPAVTSVQTAGSLDAFCDEACRSSQQQLHNDVVQGQKPALQRQQLSVPHEALAEMGESRDCVRQEHLQPFEDGERIAGALSRGSNDATARRGTARSGDCSPADNCRGCGQNERTSVPTSDEPDAPSSWEHSGRALSAREQARQLLTLLKTLQGRFALNRSALLSPSPSEEKLPFSPRGADPDNLKTASNPENSLFSRVRMENETLGGDADRERHGMYRDKGIGDVSDAWETSRQSSLSGSAAQKLVLCALARRENIAEAKLNLHELVEEQDHRCKPELDPRFPAAPANARMVASVLPAGSEMTDLPASMLSGTELNGTVEETEKAQAAYTTATLAGRGSGDRESVCSEKERTEKSSCAGCLNEEEAEDGDNMQDSSVEEGDSDNNSLSPSCGNDVGEAKRLLLVRQARMFPAVRGVYFDTRSGNLSWRCSWKVEGKKRSRSWSVLKFGMEGARAHAIAERLRQHSKACHTDDVARDFLRTFVAEKGDRTYRRGHDFTLPPMPNAGTVDDAGEYPQLQKSGGPSCLTRGTADEAGASKSGISSFTAAQLRRSDSGTQGVPASSDVNYGISASKQMLSRDTQHFLALQMPASTGTEELNMNEISSRGEPALSLSDASSCLKGLDGLTVAFSGRQQQQQEHQHMLPVSDVLAASLSSRPAYDLHTSQQSEGPPQSASSVSGARALPAAGEKTTYVSNSTPSYTSFPGIASSVVCQPGREGFPVFPVEDGTCCCWPDPPPSSAALSAENPRFPTSSRAGCVNASFLSANNAEKDGTSISGFLPQGEPRRLPQTEQSCAETISSWGDTVSSCPEAICAKRRKVFRDSVVLSPGSLPCSVNATSSPIFPAPEKRLQIPDKGEGTEGKYERVNGQKSGSQSPPASQEEEQAICRLPHEAISGEPCVTEAPAGKGRKSDTQSMPLSQGEGQAISRRPREAVSGAPFVAEARAALLTPVTIISAAAAEGPSRGGAAAAEGSRRGSSDVPAKMQQRVARAAVVAEESQAVTLQKEVQGEGRELPTKRPLPYGGRLVRGKGDDMPGTVARDQEGDRSVFEKATALTSPTVIAGKPPASGEYATDPTASAGQSASSEYARETTLLTVNPEEPSVAAPLGARESGKRVVVALSAVSAATLAARPSEAASGDEGQNTGRLKTEKSALTCVSRSQKGDHSNTPRDATAEDFFAAVHGEGRAGRDLSPVGCRDDAWNNLELEEQCSRWWCLGVDETPIAERLPHGEASSSAASKSSWSGPAAAGTTVSLESHADTLRVVHYEDTPTTAPSPTPEDLPAEAVSVLNGGSILLGKEKSVGNSPEATRDDPDERTCLSRSASAAPWLKTREVTGLEEITSRKSKDIIFGTCQEREEDRAAQEAKTREEGGRRTSAANVADEEQGGVVEPRNYSSANTGIPLAGSGSVQTRTNKAAETCTRFSMKNSDRRGSRRGSTAGEKALLSRTALVETLLKLRECLTELLQLSPRGTSPKRHRDDDAENAARALPRILLFPSASGHCTPPDTTTQEDASRSPTGVVSVHREYDKVPSTAAWCLQSFDELLETLDLRRTNGCCQKGVGGEEKLKCSRADEVEASAHDREEERAGCQDGEETPCTGGGVKALEKTIMLLLSGLLEGGLHPSSVSMLSPYKSRALLAAIITCFSNWKHQQAS